jgi:hypothetical protein
MPDQSSAATEHAIIQEITGPLQTLPEDPVATVHADFPAALRGYDRLAVDAYVQKTSHLVAELQATRSPEAAVRKALERVGEQISGILQRAHETAEEITTQSRREGEERLEQARIEAAEIVAAAHARVKELDADTDRIWIERHRIVDDARELAHQLAALADAAAVRFPGADEATEPFVEDDAATRTVVDEPATEITADEVRPTMQFNVEAGREAEAQSPTRRDPGPGSPADRRPGPAVPPPTSASKPSDDQ